MLYALVTRPKDDAQGISLELEQRGFSVIQEPLLDIRPIPDLRVDTDGVQGVLVTSANGIRALAALMPGRDLPVWAVGDASARAARQLGFVQVESAGGDVETLADLIKARCLPSAGAFLHAAASVTAGDLAGRLDQAGFAVRRLVLYQAHAAESLTDTLTVRLKTGGLAVALFYSPRTAKTFAEMLTRAGLQGTVVGTVAYCLSQAVADALAALPFATVRVAQHPTQDSLLALLDADLPRTAMTQPSSASPEMPPEPSSAAVVEPDKGLPWAGIVAGVLVVGGLGAGLATYDRWAPLVLPQKPRPVAAVVDAPVLPAPVLPPSSAPDPALASFEGRLAQLEARQAQPHPLEAEITRLSRELDELRKSSVDAAAVLRLADRVERAESLVRDLYGKRTQAVALLLAAGQLNDAVSRAMPYDPQLRAVSVLAQGDGELVRLLEILRPRAAAGIPGHAQLSSRFVAMQPAVIRAQALSLSQDQGWWRQTLERLSSLVVIRREDGLAEGNSPAAILARAAQALNQGDLAQAVQELAALDGPSAEAAALWIKDASDRVAADRAVSDLVAQVVARVGVNP